MGMLGHQAPQAPAPNEEPPADPEADAKAKQVVELQDELHVAELVAEGTAVKRRMEIVAAIRSKLEGLLSVSSSTATLQLAVLHPVLQSLSHVSPRLEGAVADPENAFRGAVLELLGRLPVAEVPKPNIPDLITACHHVLTDDHEDNGAVAQRVLFDVHKAYKQALEESTSPFFEWLKTLFEGLGGAASSQLEAAAKADPNGPRPLLAAKESMKIAQEVALMVFFLFQSYPKRLAQYGPTLLPLMISVAAIPGPELADVPPAAMPAYTEFRMAQIKTMLFVIALSRSQVVAQVLTPHKEEVCSALVRLMVTAPNSLALRKELLNCMRNMLPTPFREGLQANIDTFLDPGVLLGASQGGSDTLRQAAYMHLAELIAATKGELTLDQLRRIVQVYTHNATDVNSPITLQTTSVRLLYNLIEVLFARRGKDIATAEACRAMLASILDCMVAKLGMLRDAVPFHINILREMEDTRKERKAKEAAIAADCEAAGKRSIAARRKRLREEVAEHEKKAQANAAAVPMATDEPVKAEGAPESTEAAAPGGAPAAEAMEVDVKPEAAAADAGAGELAAGETKPAEEKEQEKDKDAEDEELLVPADAPPSPEPFRLQFQSPTITSNREREMLDFRNLLHTVISCLKNVLYITVAFHTNRGLQTPMTFTVKPWTSRPADIRGVADILTLGFQAISFYEEGMAPLNWNAREVFADLFTVLTDPREFAEIFAPRMSFLYDLVLAKHWYMHSFRHLLEGENAKRSFVDRSAAACYLRFLVSEKLHTLDDPDSPEGKLTIEWLEMCFDALPRIQPLDLHKAPQLAQHGLMSIEKAVLPHIVALLRALYPKLAAGGPTARGPTHVMRSLFYALAVTNKFQDIQAAVGQSGLHARIVDATLGILQGPSASTKEEEEAAAELCLLVPARLEHLIPLLPRMMHAAVRALTGSDRSVGVALRVLDVWVESFNPEFIERSMAAVMKPLMAALWSHIRPPPHPFGAKVAEMLGKMGGRGRRWLGDSVSVEYKAIPEYGLRVILAFPPHTSFLVPLDRCVQLAWASMESSAHEIPRRKNALRLLQICFGSLARLSLPADMLVALPAPEPTVAPEEAEPAAAAAPEGAEAAAAADAASAGEGTDTSPTEPAVRQPAAEAAPPKTVLCDDALGRLQALLFGNGKVPQIPPDFQWPNELGVKTKKQHTAEKQMLETVLTALMASVALDKELEGAKAKEFAFATCRHFALLLASGWAATATPPPAPPSSKVTKYGVRGGIPAHVATLKHLQPHVLLDAFQQGLKQNSAAARAAVVECMEVFLDTLVEVGEVQLRERKKKKEAEKEVDKEKEKAKEKEKESAEEDDPVNPAVPDPKAKLSDTMPYLNVQQDLVMRAMHCCYGDNWPTRLGGVAALKALASRMPHEWLMRAANYLTKALMAVLRTLPDNAVKEQEDITAILLDIVRRALNLPAESKTTEEQQQQAGQSGGEDDAPTNMEVEPEEETAAQTGKRGKRTKRGGPQPARKRQQREEDASPSGKDATPPANAQPGKDGSEGDGPREDESMPDGIRRLQNDLLQAVMSSKSNDAVRAAATQCLQLLAQNAKTSVGAMFSQMLSRQPSSRTLLERRMLPLRSIATQTNYAHSTAFLLRSCPEQLELTPSLATFVADSCTLMELDDQMLGSSVTVRGQPPKADVITKLQVACMEVLVAALNWPAFRDAKDQNVGNHNWAAPGEVAVPVQHLRDRIMKAFIRRLGSTSERVVALSVEGIETILKHKMLEKNMLQEALRPILMDLAVYQRMTLHLLRHVHRLLDLLAGQFNVTLGQKLTEHLQKWMKAEEFLHTPAQPVAWEPGTEWEVAASMLDVFHKLPPAAAEFLETQEGRTGIVVLTIGLEEALPQLQTPQLQNAIVPSKLWSPYRAPLTRFLNRYPSESVAYFLDSASRISKPDYFLLLLDIIRNPLGRPLLDALKKAPEKFVKVLQLETDDANPDIAPGQLNCIHLLAAISELCPDWLPKELFNVVLDRWRALGREPEPLEDEDGVRSRHLESEWLAHLLLNYARRHPEESDILFELVRAFSIKIAVDFAFVREYLVKDFPRESTAEHKRQVFVKWMESFSASKDNSADVVNTMRYLVNPMVLYAVTHNQEAIVTSDMAQGFVTRVLQTLSSDADSFTEQAQAEAIHLCTILLQHASAVLNDRRKEIIQYAWWTLKQDNMAKSYAFLCVGYFLEAFHHQGTQDNVVWKAFTNMVRMSPPDSASREAVKQAIDLIVPFLTEGGDAASSTVAADVDGASDVGSLEEIAGGSGTNGKKRPVYVSLVRRVLAEEGPNSPALVTILQMVVRNREAFASSRGVFMPIMLNNLSRLGLANQASLDGRVLAVDMAATLYWWDRKAAEEKVDDGSQPADMVVREDNDPAADAKRQLRLTPAMDESIMNFLLRMAFVSCEVRDRDELGWRRLHAHCMDVLRDAARYRPPSPLKLQFFDKLLQNNINQSHGPQAGQHGEGSSVLITGLRVVNTFLEFQPDSIVMYCPNQIAMMLDPSIYSRNRIAVELLAAATRSLFSAFPPALAEQTDKSGAVGIAIKIQTRIRDVLMKSFNIMADPATFAAEYLWSVCNSVTVLKGAIQAAPDSMQAVIHSLLKAMNRLAKDHNAQPHGALLSNKGIPKEAPTDAEYSSGAWFMYHALQVAVPSALVLSAEHRKLFLSTLVMLITGQSVRQGQTDAGIIFAVLGLMRGWLLLAPKQSYLTSKELLVLLQRLAQIDRLHAVPLTLKPAWDEKFLDVLYAVITTKKEENFGEEVFVRVERTFCSGLQSSDPDTRQKFFKLYSDRIPRDLFERLRFIIQVQDWDFLSHTFWLKHAVALLFDCLHMRDAITLAFNSAHVPSLFNFKEGFVFNGSHQGPNAQPGSKRADGLTSTPPAQAEGSGDTPGDVKGATEGGAAAPPEVPVAAAPAEGGNQPSPAAAPPSDSVPRASGNSGPNSRGGNSGSKLSGSSRNAPPPVLDIPLPDGVRSMLQGHLEFLDEHTGLKSESLVTCLIEQVQNDPLVAHHLWVLLFPIVWTSLQKEQQTGLAKPIIQLLSKEHHLRQAYLRPTVGQTLLDGISMSQPQPKIPAEMIKYMGRQFHAWHTAISMLESHVGLFPQDMRCFDAVCDLYTALGEEDMRAGLWQRRAAAEETRIAVSLQQHGYLVEAQSLFLEMMSRGVSGGVSGVTKSEMVLWHNQYLACCIELNQWETVAEYAKSTENAALQLEAAAKLHDWVNLKQMVVPKAQVEEGAEFTMIKAQMQLSDASILEVDKLCRTALNQCVVRWWQMPESSPYSYAPVLHAFQRAVELTESWRVMMEFSMQGGAGGQYQDLKDIADTWKLRTPNEWEPVRWWSDVLTWRNQVYNMTIRQFSTMQAANPNLHQMGYRDKAWSVNRLGHVARLHHLPEACVHIINSLYGFNAMEVQEAFVKVQEQAKAYMLRPSEHLHGLNLINSTNMDYFQAAHQAEMFCLKAQFLHLLGDIDEANKTFSQSLTLWSLCPDAWVNWGRFCDDRYASTRQPQFLEFAAAAYTQGIRLSGTEARSLVPRVLNLLMLDVHGAEAVGRQLVQQAGDLPTWVWLPWVPQLVTGLQRPETAAARRILVSAASQHPQHIFWHIRPVMVTLKDAAVKAVAAAKEKALQAEKAQAEAPAAGKAAAEGAEPQEGAKPDDGSREGEEAGGKATKADDEMADADASAADGQAAAGGALPGSTPPPSSTASAIEGTGAGPRIEKPMEVIAYDNAKEVMEALRAKQTPALQSLDVFITELGHRFATRTDERLLAVVYTLLHRTYKAPMPASSPVPEHLKGELASVCKACSGKDGASTGGNGGSGWNNWTRYQQEFARDLDPESDAAPRTLGELADRLKGWRTMMEAMIEDMHPAVSKLEDHAPALVDMTLDEVEMPCQAPPCPDGPDPVFIERVSTDVDVVRRSCTSARRLTLFGSDGQVRHFLLSGHQSSGTSPLWQGEERVGQFLRAANSLLASHPESRRRGLAFLAPRSLALFPAGRITEDDPSTCLYVDAYETYCSRYGREPDAPIVLFRDRTCLPDGKSAEVAVRKAAYDEIVEKLVTENIFSQYMYKTMVENSRVMWTFKRQFALSTAMSALACFVLKLSGRAPNKVAVSKARGEVTQLELAAIFNDRLQMDINKETVPFRLTRNMTAFIGPHGLEGLLIAVAVAAVQGLMQERSCLPSQLALFLRDDILAFVQRRLNVRSIASIKLPQPQVEAAVTYNVTQCLGRLEKVGPKSSVTPPTQDGQLANPEAGMRDLMNIATNPINLCQMDPNWQPWL